MRRIILRTDMSKMTWAESPMGAYIDFKSQDDYFGGWIRKPSYGMPKAEVFLIWTNQWEGIKLKYETVQEAIDDLETIL